MDALEIEVRVAEYFGIRTNIIVPNVSWGFSIHECDLLCISPHGYLSEIEIKVSRSDLKADLKKDHGHIDNRIKKLYFAMPEKITDSIMYVPDRAGIICVSPKCWIGGITILREPVVNKNARPLRVEEKLNIARLATMRVWKMKRNLLNRKAELDF